MANKSKQAPSQDEELRQELYNKILELKSSIEYGEELFKYFNDTMEHFAYPENRVKGTDYVSYQENGESMKKELVKLEKTYKRTYERSTTTGRGAKKSNS